MTDIDDSQDNVIQPQIKPLIHWTSNPYIQSATSDNTRKAYRSDIRHFESWGGRLPASSESIVKYLQAFADKLNPRTLSRRLTALKNWHIYQGFLDPTTHPAIVKTIAGITRVHGQPKEKAYPLLPEHMLAISKFLHEENSMAACRDNALLQIGYFGAFRRSELVQIRCEDLEWKTQGIDILIPQSKTDQMHTGQFCAIPYGKHLLCPVTTLKQWLEMANIQTGYIFVELKKGGKLTQKALTPLSVNHILKKQAERAGILFANELSSHSLRRGLATSASLLGANIAAIMRQGRWKQVNTVMEYVDAADRFSENAASLVLEKMEES